MGLIPDEQLEKIREGVDIVAFVSEYLPLKQSGRNHKGLCPFHTEKTPSFMVNADKQIFHCFGCGEGGNVFTFLMKFEGISFVEAVQALGERVGVDIRFDGRNDETQSLQLKKRYARVNHLAAEFYFNQLHDESGSGRQAADYLKQRGIEARTAQHFLLGFAPSSGRELARYLESKKVPLELAEKVGLLRRGDDGHYFDFFRGRLIFPIRNSAGQFIAFGGRSLSDDQQPKYLNTPESPLYHKGREVYGLFEARTSLREAQQALIVEGYMDVLALAQHGFTHTVAPLGTALTADQVKRLSRHSQELVVIFDGDQAGLKAAWRSLETTSPLGIPTRIFSLPEGEDPDSFIRTEGRENFGAGLLAAPALMDYFIDKVVAQSPADNVGKVQAARKLVPQLARIVEEVEKGLYIQRLASKLGLTEAVIRREITALGHRGRNFVQAPADDIDARRHKGVRLTPFERDLLRAVLSNVEGAAALRDELEAGDWQHTVLRGLWPGLQAALDQGRSPAEILGGLADEGLSQELTELLLSDSSVDAGEAEDLVTSCRQRLQRQHLVAQRQNLASQLRKAEAEADTGRVIELMTEHNRLLIGG